MFRSSGNKSLKKACKNDAKAPKRKHVRALILQSWKDKSSAFLFTALETMHDQLRASPRVCFKALTVMHTVILEGHPRAGVDLHTRSTFLAALKKDVIEALPAEVMAEHFPLAGAAAAGAAGAEASPKKGYAAVGADGGGEGTSTGGGKGAGGSGANDVPYERLVGTYVDFLRDKAALQASMPPELSDWNYDDFVSGGAPVFAAEVAIQTTLFLLDLQDQILAFHSTLVPRRPIGAMEDARAGCLVPLVQDAHTIYLFTCFFLNELVASGDAGAMFDLLTARFYAQYSPLTTLFDDARGIPSVADVRFVPSLPVDPPVFVSGSAFAPRQQPPSPHTSAMPSYGGGDSGDDSGDLITMTSSVRTDGVGEAGGKPLPAKPTDALARREERTPSLGRFVGADPFGVFDSPPAAMPNSPPMLGGASAGGSVDLLGLGLGTSPSSAPVTSDAVRKPAVGVSVGLDPFAPSPAAVGAAGTGPSASWGQSPAPQATSRGGGSAGLLDGLDFSGSLGSSMPTMTPTPPPQAAVERPQSPPASAAGRVPGGDSEALLSQLRDAVVALEAEKAKSAGLTEELRMAEAGLAAATRVERELRASVESRDALVGSLQAQVSSGEEQSATEALLVAERDRVADLEAQLAALRTELAVVEERAATLDQRVVALQAEAAASEARRVRDVQAARQAEAAAVRAMEVAVVRQTFGHCADRVRAANEAAGSGSSAGANGGGAEAAQAVVEAASDLNVAIHRLADMRKRSETPLLELVFAAASQLDRVALAAGALVSSARAVGDAQGEDDPEFRRGAESAVEDTIASVVGLVDALGEGLAGSNIESELELGDLLLGVSAGGADLLAGVDAVLGRLQAQFEPLAAADDSDDDDDDETAAAAAEEAAEAAAEAAEAAAAANAEETAGMQAAVYAGLEEASRMIDEAAARMAALQAAPPEMVEGAHAKLPQVSDAIMGTTAGIAATLGTLVRNAAVVQRELEASGAFRAGAPRYRESQRWSQGLVSAARHVADATVHLVDTADSTVTGAEEIEALIVASRNVSSSTALLVSASRAKADPDSPSHAQLEVAAKEVVRANRVLVDVATALQDDGGAGGDDAGAADSPMPSSSTGSKVKEMELQMRVLKLEKELENARSALMRFRRSRYSSGSS